MIELAGEEAAKVVPLFYIIKKLSIRINKVKMANLQKIMPHSPLMRTGDPFAFIPCFLERKEDNRNTNFF